MNSNQAKRFLARHGCTFQSGKGGHLLVRRGDRKSILPQHGGSKEIGTGLWQKILKDLGLSGRTRAKMVRYPIILQDDGGTVLVTSPDFSEFATFGEDETDARVRAVDALVTVIAGRIADREDIPHPSEIEDAFVVLTTSDALKIALYRAMRADGLGKADLARRLQCHKPQVDRLLDLTHESKLEQIEAALAAVGRVINVDVVAA